MHTRRLLAALALGITAAAPTFAVDIGDFTFTGFDLPLDASMNGGVVVGWRASPAGNGALNVSDHFVYDAANNLFHSLGVGTTGSGPGNPEVSYDGSVISGGINTIDFGGDPNNISDGPFLSAGYWSQTSGQPVGTGVWADALEVDAPVISHAYNNYVNNVMPPVASDRNIGNAYAMSGDGNVLGGRYYRQHMSGVQQGGGFAMTHDIAAGTTTGYPGTGIGVQSRIEALNLDGSVAGGWTGNQLAAVWVNGVMTQLSHPDGNTGRVVAVSDDGTRLAGFQRVFDDDTGVNTQAQVAWDYDADTGQWDRIDIGRIDGRTLGLAQSTGMTADGSVIVGYDQELTLIQGGTPTGAANNSEATFWSRYTGLVQLEDFMVARGVDVDSFGIELASLQGISPDGNTLLVWGFSQVPIGSTTTVNDMTGIIIDVSDTPLAPEANEDLRNTAIANLGTAASYVGDTYYGDWNQDGLVTQEDLDILGAILDGVTGDLNGDLYVGQEDLDILLANWDRNVTPGSLIDGDADGNGVVNGLDLAIVQANWGSGTLPSNNVPEPTSLALLALGGLALTRRRRRNVA